MGGNPVLATGEPLEALLWFHAADDAAAVMAQFRNTHYVYRYNNQHALAATATSSTHAVMEPQDMGDNARTVSGAYVAGEACVIQALQSIGTPLPSTGMAGTNQRHHAYSAGQGIDYRTDFDYLRLYIDRYGLHLVHSRLTAWGDVGWPTLGAGHYVMISYAAQS